MKKIIYLFLVQLVFVSTSVYADKPLNVTLCNKTDKPILFAFYNHNDFVKDIGIKVPFSKKLIRDCSCVESKGSHTDLWNNLPIAEIKQVIYRDVGKVSGTSIKACISATGKFKGYIDVSTSTCAEAQSKTSYLPAPELTLAQGDLPVLDSRLTGVRTRCIRNKKTNKCEIIRAKYDYEDGHVCFGNGS